jgi:YebC/PmpR family DNA-binding regulatory protein
MAGHSKWANIKHRKAGQDAKRGKVFTKMLREITVAVKTGGMDSATNPTLRTAIDKALGVNMRRDTIDNAIKKAAGAQEGVNYEEMRYEGYGPAGIAIIVDCLSDNRNRTVSDVRHAFTKAGGNLGTDGSVAYLFKKLGIISYPVGVNEDALIEAALEAGADDVVTNEDGSVDVMTAVEEYLTIKETLQAAWFAYENAEVTQQADITHSLGVDDAEKLIRLIDLLEDLDDVQNVYSNADISAEVMKQLSSK